jgi:CHAT domain-containing protein/tetratricopeptide (TPR) repeat protein
VNADDDQVATLLGEFRALPHARRIDRFRTVIAEDDDALTKLLDEAEHMAVVHVDEALAVTAMMIELTDTAGHPFGRARSRRARSYALSHAGRFEEALVASFDAIRLADEAGDRIEAARARLGSMQALCELGRDDHAIRAGEEAQATFLSQEETELAVRVGINLGIVHLRRDDPARALDRLDEARALLDDDAALLGPIENTRGEALYALCDFNGAERAFLSAQHVFVREKQALSAAIAEGNLADLAARQGRLHKAMYHFERARRHLESDGATANHARIIAEQAEAMSLLGMPGESIPEYELALARLDECGLARQGARARAGMGRALLRCGRLSEAETALAAAAQAFAELRNDTQRARVDLARAELARLRGDAARAKRIALSALAHLEDHPIDSAIARHLLAEIAAADDDGATVEAELAMGLSIARRLDLPPLLADLLHTRGAHALQRGNRDAAKRDLHEAIVQIERVRGTLQAERFRAAYLTNRIVAYEDLIAALLDAGTKEDLAEAFAVVEQSKSRCLLDTVQTSIDAAGPDPSDPAARRLADVSARLRGELNVLYSRLADEGRAETGSDAWREPIRRREAELAAIDHRRDSARGTVGITARPGALPEAQRLVPDDTVLLEYSIARGELHLLCVGADRITAHRSLATIDRVNDRIRRLQFQMSRITRPGADASARLQRMTDDARRELGALFDMLIGPAIDEIRDARQLIVVPHGPLHVVPMHALWDGTHHLIEHHAVRYAPSASVLAGLEQSCDRRPALDSAVILAAPDHAAPCVTDEAERVALALGAAAPNVLIDADATTGRLAAAARDASILHLACHGHFDSRNPFASGLRLNDRWLTVRDILSLSLDADLVTLSGCDTGVTSVRRGDELVGLMRSFIAAGARSLLVSLWLVNDASTADLMVDFYTRWRHDPARPLAKATALRDAQLEAMRERRHPGFWAPFILVGSS